MPFSPNIPSNEGKSIRERHFFFYTSNKESKLFSINPLNTNYLHIRKSKIQGHHIPFFIKY
jgi:hypothetical protein